MKTLSVTDLKLIDELKHLNFFEIIHPDNDALVAPFLRRYGIDTDKPIEYRAYRHRNLQGQVVVNFLISGELLLDRASLTSEFSSIEDRKIAASMYDRSLFEDLHAMGHTSPAYGGDWALDKKVPMVEDDEYVQEEIKIAQEIAQLEDVLFHIRGSQRKPDGSIKTYADYKTPEAVPEKRKRTRRKNVEKGMGE